MLEENPCIIKLSNSWLIRNPGGGPTPDKPDISVVNYEPGNTVSSFMNLRVANIQACDEQWSSKGAEFVTPPIDRGPEIRCYMRDPDGYMIEVGQATRLLEGRLAKKRPEDLPGLGDRTGACQAVAVTHSGRVWHPRVDAFCAEVLGTDAVRECDGASVVAPPAFTQAQRRISAPRRRAPPTRAATTSTCNRHRGRRTLGNRTTGITRSGPRPVPA